MERTPVAADLQLRRHVLSDSELLAFMGEPARCSPELLTAGIGRRRSHSGTQTPHKKYV